MAAIMFQGFPFLKVGGSLDPNVIILDLSLHAKNMAHLLFLDPFTSILTIVVKGDFETFASNM